MVKRLYIHPLRSLLTVSRDNFRNWFIDTALAKEFSCRNRDLLLFDDRTVYLADPYTAFGVFRLYDDHHIRFLFVCLGIPPLEDIVFLITHIRDFINKYLDPHRVRDKCMQKIPVCQKNLQAKTGWWDYICVK